MIGGETLSKSRLVRPFYFSPFWSGAGGVLLEASDQKSFCEIFLQMVAEVLVLSL